MNCIYHRSFWSHTKGKLHASSSYQCFYKWSAIWWPKPQSDIFRWQSGLSLEKSCTRTHRWSSPGWPPFRLLQSRSSWFWAGTEQTTWRPVRILGPRRSSTQWYQESCRSCLCRQAEHSQGVVLEGFHQLENRTCHFWFLLAGCYRIGLRILGWSWTRIQCLKWVCIGVVGCWWWDIKIRRLFYSRLWGLYHLGRINEIYIRVFWVIDPAEMALGVRGEIDHEEISWISGISTVAKENSSQDDHEEWKADPAVDTENVGAGPSFVFA